MEGYFHIITRKKAEELGIRFFFTGKPCRNHGNYWLRGVNRGKCWCPDCKKDRRETGYKWFNENGDYEKKKEKLREYAKTEKAKTVKRARRAVLRNWGVRTDPVKNNGYAKTWKTKYPERYMLAQLNTKIKKKYPDAMPKDELELNEFALVESIKLKILRKEATGHDWHIDHMVPLSKGGTHSWDNIQVIPWLMNIMKKDRMIFTKPYQWFDFA